MAQDLREALSVRAEQALLVGVLLSGSTFEEDEPLGELEQLAQTAGAKIVGCLAQKRPRIDPSCYLGRGKLDELRELVAEREADVVICDDDLTPTQTRNLERELDLKVIDRSELILDIFATRARTKQARLQVELAQLQYNLPRLMRMWTHLSRMEGGVGIQGGIGTRGPGEKQLEEDRRVARRRIQELQRSLKHVEARRVREVQSRFDETTVSLVGYTNAGKSTLMNRLTGAGVFVQDKLFATLDTRTRECALGDGRVILLSDTVGFIRKLPHHLVASFRATLEEARHADLLLHVVDAGSPEREHHIESVQQVLHELNCDGRPVITVMNKIDTVRVDGDRLLMEHQWPSAVVVSAMTGDGMGDLDEALQRFVDSRMADVRVVASISNGKLQAILAQRGRILERHFDDHTVTIRAQFPRKLTEKLKQYGATEVIVDPPDGPPADHPTVSEPEPAEMP